MVAIARLSQQSAEANLARLLNCDADQAGLASAIAAEHMRAMLYGIGNLQAVASTVHTTRLLTNARRILGLMWPVAATRAQASTGSAPEGDTSASVLRSMARLGDAVDTGRGQWLAAPTRVIALNSTPHGLLLGSIPHHLTQAIFGNPVICAGASRYISSVVLKPELRDCIQTADIWLTEMQSLAAWTEKVLLTHGARMQEASGVSADQLELYAPDVLRMQRRTGRWMASNQIDRPIDGIRLCRPQSGFAYEHARPYYLGNFELNGRGIALRSYAPVAHELTLRLRFGLDSRLGIPRRFSITVTQNALVIDRPGPLPEPESRIYALGWANPSSDQLTFHTHALPFIIHALQRLAITPTIAQRQTS